MEVMTASAGRERRTPRMCRATGGEAPDGHVHFCMEDAGHHGKHTCLIGTDHGTCGHTW